MAGIAWNQWNSLESRLRGSDYGELLRLADESGAEVKLPYFVTLFVALSSAFWSAVTAIVIQGVNSELAEAVLLGVTGFLAVWSLLSLSSLAIHSAGHDSRISQIEAMREEMAATQRRHEAEKRQEESVDAQEREETNS